METRIREGPDAHQTHLYDIQHRVYSSTPDHPHSSRHPTLGTQGGRDVSTQRPSFASVMTSPDCLERSLCSSRGPGRFTMELSLTPDALDADLDESGSRNHLQHREHHRRVSSTNVWPSPSSSQLDAGLIPSPWSPSQHPLSTPPSHHSHHSSPSIANHREFQRHSSQHQAGDTMGECQPSTASRKRQQGSQGSSCNDRRHLLPSCTEPFRKVRRLYDNVNDVHGTLDEDRQRKTGGESSSSFMAGMSPSLSASQTLSGKQQRQEPQHVSHRVFQSSPSLLRETEGCRPVYNSLPLLPPTALNTDAEEDPRELDPHPRHHLSTPPPSDLPFVSLGIPVYVPPSRLAPSQPTSPSPSARLSDGSYPTQEKGCPSTHQTDQAHFSMVGTSSLEPAVGMSSPPKNDATPSPNQPQRQSLFGTGRKLSSRPHSRTTGGRPVPDKTSSLTTTPPFAKTSPPFPLHLTQSAPRCVSVRLPVPQLLSPNTESLNMSPPVSRLAHSRSYLPQDGTMDTIVDGALSQGNAHSHLQEGDGFRLSLEESFIAGYEEETAKRSTDSSEKRLRRRECHRHCSYEQRDEGPHSGSSHRKSVQRTQRRSELSISGCWSSGCSGCSRTAMDSTDEDEATFLYHRAYLSPRRVRRRCAARLPVWTSPLRHKQATNLSMMRQERSREGESRELSHYQHRDSHLHPHEEHRLRHWREDEWLEYSDDDGQSSFTSSGSLRREDPHGRVDGQHRRHWDARRAHRRRRLDTVTTRPVPIRSKVQTYGSVDYALGPMEDDEEDDNAVGPYHGSGPDASPYVMIHKASSLEGQVPTPELPIKLVRLSPRLNPIADIPNLQKEISTRTPWVGALKRRQQSQPLVQAAEVVFPQTAELLNEQQFHPRRDSMATTIERDKGQSKTALGESMFIRVDTAGRGVVDSMVMDSSIPDAMVNEKHTARTQLSAVDTSTNRNDYNRTSSIGRGRCIDSTPVTRSKGKRTVGVPESDNATARIPCDQSVRQELRNLTPNTPDVHLIRRRPSFSNRRTDYRSSSIVGQTVHPHSQSRPPSILSRTGVGRVLGSPVEKEGQSRRTLSHAQALLSGPTTVLQFSASSGRRDTPAPSSALLTTQRIRSGSTDRSTLRSPVQSNDSPLLTPRIVPKSGTSNDSDRRRGTAAVSFQSSSSISTLRRSPTTGENGQSGQSSLGVDRESASHNSSFSSVSQRRDNRKESDDKSVDGNTHYPGSPNHAMGRLSSSSRKRNLHNTTSRSQVDEQRRHYGPNSNGGGGDNKDGDDGDGDEESVFDAEHGARRNCEGISVQKHSTKGVSQKRKNLNRSPIPGSSLRGPSSLQESKNDPVGSQSVLGRKMRDSRSKSECWVMLDDAMDVVDDKGVLSVEEDEGNGKKHVEDSPDGVLSSHDLMPMIEDGLDALDIREAGIGATLLSRYSEAMDDFKQRGEQRPVDVDDDDDENQEKRQQLALAVNKRKHLQQQHESSHPRLEPSLLLLDESNRRRFSVASFGCQVDLCLEEEEENRRQREDSQLVFLKPKPLKAKPKLGRRLQQLVSTRSLVPGYDPNWGGTKEFPPLRFIPWHELPTVRPIDEDTQSGKQARPIRRRTPNLRHWMGERVVHEYSETEKTIVSIGVMKRLDVPDLRVKTEDAIRMMRTLEKKEKRKNILPLARDPGPAQLTSGNNDEDALILRDAVTAEEENAAKKKKKPSTQRVTKQQPSSRRSVDNLFGEDVDREMEDERLTKLKNGSQATGGQVMRRKDLKFIPIDSRRSIPYEVALVSENAFYDLCEMHFPPMGDKGYEIASSSINGNVLMAEDQTCLIVVGDQLAKRSNITDIAKSAKVVDRQKIQIHENEEGAMLLSHNGTFHIPEGVCYNIANLSKINKLMISATVLRRA